MITGNIVAVARGKGKQGLRGGGQKQGMGVSAILSAMKIKMIDR